MPLPFDEPPDLEPGLEIYFRAWRALDTCRSYGMDAGPIPWDAADRWCARHGIHGDAADDLWTLVRAMDEAAREFWKTREPPADEESAEPEVEAEDEEESLWA